MKSERAVAGMALELFNPDRNLPLAVFKSKHPPGNDWAMMMGMGISSRSLKAKAGETVGKKIGDFLPALNPYCLDKTVLFFRVSQQALARGFEASRASYS